MRNEVTKTVSATAVTAALLAGTVLAAAPAQAVEQRKHVWGKDAYACNVYTNAQIKY